MTGASERCGHPHPAITMYTRPRCAYCFLLRRRLRRRGLAFTEINIRDDPAAAAAVRAVADGNETVPTVEIMGRWLVNPSARQISESVEA